MDPYQILGVEKGASKDKIKKAYRKLAHQHHPDKEGGDEEKFKEINAAYQILSDDEKRAQYDQFGQTFEGAQGQGFSGFEDIFGGGFGGSSRGFNVDLGDIFEDFFGGRAHRSGQTRGGEDIAVDVTVSLEEVVKGAERTLELNRLGVCGHCKGHGAEPDAGLEECPRCNGAGKIEERQQTFLGAFSRVRPCPECHGQGKHPKEKCTNCQGQGRIRSTERVQVTIPQGVEDGVTLRMTGEGEAGARGAPAGDLYARVHVGEHDTFERRGTNLYTTVRVPFTTVVLGGSATVPLLGDETKTLTIPKGTPSGKVLRVKGQGLPAMGGGSRGALYVTIEVDVPERLSKEQKKLLEELQEHNL